VKRWQGIASGVATAAPVDTAVESKYTPITPCRIVDTRNAGGKLAANTTRSYIAAGAGGFTPQGGASGGCGIPSAATAVQVTITAVSATGPGYLRAYPASTTAPGATFLNYTNTFNTSGSGSVTLGNSGGHDFKISNYVRATHVVVDVQGYYVKPMWALIDGNGTVVKSSRVTHVSHPQGGWYTVDFDRDISSCALTATPYYFGYSVQADLNSSGPSVTANVTTTVVTAQGATLSDAEVYVVATC